MAGDSPGINRRPLMSLSAPFIYPCEVNPQRCRGLPRTRKNDSVSSKRAVSFATDAQDRIPIVISSGDNTVVQPLVVGPPVITPIIPPWANEDINGNGVPDIMEPNSGLRRKQKEYQDDRLIKDVKRRHSCWTMFTTLILWLFFITASIGAVYKTSSYDGCRQEHPDELAACKSALTPSRRYYQSLQLLFISIAFAILAARRIFPMASDAFTWTSRALFFIGWYAYYDIEIVITIDPISGQTLTNDTYARIIVGAAYWTIFLYVLYRLLSRMYYD